MRRISALTYCLIYVMIFNGCAGHPGTANRRDNGEDGLVGLMGVKICQETRTDKMWQMDKQGPFSSLEEAERYTTGLRLGDFDDWRLPTKSEMFELFYMHYWKKDGTCVMNHRGEFWSLSKDQKPVLGHWEDDLLCGPEFNFVESIKPDGFVRAIRP